jgi:sorting nexin-29
MRTNQHINRQNDRNKLRCVTRRRSTAIAFQLYFIEFAIRRVQANQEGFNLHGTNQLLVYADDVNILGVSVHTVKENADTLMVSTKEIGLEVNADKTTYIAMPRDQNAGQSHDLNTDNRSFEKLEEFNHLGTTLTNQNSIQEEIKNRLNSGNARYYSVQNLLSSSLLSKNLKIKI